MALHFAIIRTNDAHPENEPEVLIAHDMQEALASVAAKQARFGSRKRSARKVRAAYEQAVLELHRATTQLP